jgi:hypothetical protein
MYLLRILVVFLLELPERTAALLVLELLLAVERR